MNNISKIETKALDLFYGHFQALKNIHVSIPPQKITAFIGPSGCGKSTLLRAYNRMNDLIKGVKVTGEVLLDGKNIYSSKMKLISLRKRVGMVFQRPNPFPISTYENVAFGPRIHGITNREQLDNIVETSLKATGMWKDVKDKLQISALALAPEQQQRLCISRLLAVEPEVLLMDEPCSALDPIATAKIEELILELKKCLTVVIVTHNMQQAARVSDYSAFMLLGDLVEFGETKEVFTNPKDKRTQDYITGRFG